MRLVTMLMVVVVVVALRVCVPNIDPIRSDLQAEI